jgi:hypothetical protein
VSAVTIDTDSPFATSSEGMHALLIHLLSGVVDFDHVTDVVAKVSRSQNHVGTKLCTPKMRAF